MPVDLRTEYTEWLAKYKDKLPQMWEVKGDLTDEEMFSMFYQEHTCGKGSFMEIMCDLAYQIQELQNEIDKIYGEFNELYQ